VIAHVSDIHIDGTEERAERTARVMAYLNGLGRAPDAVLVTGDLADHGLPEEYREVRKLLASPHQVFTCPGNHDERRAYREVLLGAEREELDGPVNRLHRAGGALFALLDSSIPGQDDGLLDDDTIGWLDEALTSEPDNVPVFVCFHHPPVTLHMPLVDAIRQRGEQRLAEVVGRHPQTVALLCGHAHTPAVTTFAGRPLLVAPGVASTVTLPWEPGTGIDYEQPPAIAFHILDDERRLTTHYRVVI
jgi:3',5'-cyclic AMP phosphodiesterase CpdA